MTTTISNWNTEYRSSYPPKNHQAERVRLYCSGNWFENHHEIIQWIKSYDFFGLEGYFVN